MKLTTLLLFSAIALQAEENFTKLKPDEQISFYPSVAQRVPGETNLWRAEIRGNVFEPENQRLMVAMFREAMELKTDEMTSAESLMFGERSRLFLVDYERGKKIYIRLGTNEYFVGKSSADGRFAGEISFTDSAVTSFAAVLKPGDVREFKCQIFPLKGDGISVISDIDDTIKITEVRDKAVTLRNTFLREFQAVPGMAEFYQRLAGIPLTPSLSPSDGERVARGRVRGRLEGFDSQTGNVSFHYISASPWQLYNPLATFVETNGFPAGTFELKQFRWKDRSLFSLFAKPEKYKLGVIEPLLKQFPKRKFILVGDSGERDPEIYGALERKFPEQIIFIYIRDVTTESADCERYQKAFQDVPRVKWRIFRSPDQITVAPE